MAVKPKADSGIVSLCGRGRKMRINKRKSIRRKKGLDIRICGGDYSVMQVNRHACCPDSAKRLKSQGTKKRHRGFWGRDACRVEEALNFEYVLGC